MGVANSASCWTGRGARAGHVVLVLVDCSLVPVDTICPVLRSKLVCKLGASVATSRCFLARVFLLLKTQPGGGKFPRKYAILQGYEGRQCGAAGAALGKVRGNEKMRRQGEENEEDGTNAVPQAPPARK
eukprot:gene11329-biopygen16856